MAEFSHFDARGMSRMVNIGNKHVTQRVARASGRLRMKADTLELIRDRRLSKGDVLEVARLAGIMASKRTAELIPLCHPLPLEAVDIHFDYVSETCLAIEVRTEVTARTGVEMEALLAVSVAALTIYDMCKAVDREIAVERVQLEEKSGGRSGHFSRSAHPEVK